MDATRTLRVEGPISENPAELCFNNRVQPESIGADSHTYPGGACGNPGGAGRSELGNCTSFASCAIKPMAHSVERRARTSGSNFEKRVDAL